MQKWHIDFETRSEAPLNRTGSHVYSQHPSTQILCMAWGSSASDVRVWQPGEAAPDALLRAISGGAMIGAHNSGFEADIWANVVSRDFPSWPKLPRQQFDDTMARAAAVSLPQDLDTLAVALGVSARKDKEGHRLMMRMSKPLPLKQRKAVGGGMWLDTPEHRARLAAYCMQDVRVECAVDAILPPLSPSERKLWELDQAINARGVQVDGDAVRGAAAVVSAVAVDLDAEMANVTGGAVEGASKLTALANWLTDNGCPLPVERATRKKTVKGVTTFREIEVMRITKDTVSTALQDFLSDDVRRVLEIRRDAGMASVKKLGPMAKAVSSDGRARNQFAFHGATTGRWAGRGIQLQNMKRPSFKQPVIEQMIETLGQEGAADALRYGYGEPIDCIASCLRGMLMAAPGHTFFDADFANIEGRVLAWLAHEEWKVKAFAAFDAAPAGPGKDALDLYRVSYGRSFHVRPQDVDDDQRQIGKVQELSLGYQGGWRAFKQMGANYGISVIDEEAGEVPPPKAKLILTRERAETIKDLWREAHPNVRTFWREIEQAAIDAVLAPGTTTRTRGGKITYRFVSGYLLCRLPSGRVIAYPRPRVDWEPSKFKPGTLSAKLKFFGKVKGKTWGDCGLYGGLLTENVVQAIARDCLAEAMTRLETSSYPVAIHVHDQAVCEVLPNADLDRFKALVSQVPIWAAGLPMACSIRVGPRFQK